MGYSRARGTLIHEKKKTEVENLVSEPLMYRPILCTFFGAVDFLNVLKKGCNFNCPHFHLVMERAQV
jgi:hypothetical protein